MLKHFLRQGVVFHLIALATWFVWIFNLLDVIVVGRFGFETMIYLVLGFLATLLEAMALYPWYGKSHRGFGIEEHFGHVAVAVIYLFLLTNLMRLTDVQILWLEVVFGALFFLVLLLNFVLLSYHFRDTDRTPPGFYSRNLHLANGSAHG